MGVSTVHRYVSRLVEVGLLERDPADAAETGNGLCALRVNILVLGVLAYP
jgi:DNA-binding IclR family transcriptional regulator